MSFPDLVETINALLAEDKTIRDPVHGDVVLNFLETAVIDTRIFQRLRRIKQLGTVSLVFPGAEHSRFQHSLGTLYVADILLRSISKNALHGLGDTEIQQKSFTLVVRLAALLHDLYELPFSHTLEKEGHVFEEQWKDDDLNRKIFGRESELFSTISDSIDNLATRTTHVQKTLLPNQWDSTSTARNLAATILVLVYKILTETKEKTSDVARALFGSEIKLLESFDERYLEAAGYIIRNTICADLLDYLARDFYFCGIDKKYDKRFLVYSTIFIPSDDTRKTDNIVFAYSLIDKRGRIKQSVLSSLFDVIELRYSLAEMVHTHRVKNAFSAMVIEAFNLHYQSLKAKERTALKARMMSMGDDELLDYLQKANCGSKYILDFYFGRRTYQEFVLWDNWNSDYNSRALSKEGLDELTDAEQRLQLERTLMKWINKKLPEDKKLQDGDILIYVMPNPEKLWKELETYVVHIGSDHKPTVSTLKSLSTENVLTPRSPMMEVVVRRIEAQQKLLQSKYCNLWRISLFLSPKINLNDSDYKTIPNEASELISKIFRYQGIDVRPTETREPIVMPDELNRILIKINTERRSFWTMKDLFEFPV
jgi:HD superfamily phosphohydrolase